MYDAKILNYNGQPLRQVELIDGTIMWSLRDVCKILGYKSIAGSVTRRLKGCHQRTAVIKNDGSFRGIKLIFIDKSGMAKLMNDPQAADFRKWFEEATGIKSVDVECKPQQQSLPLSLAQTSVEARIQQAQMLIRIAEHKAVPQDEQLRLLNMAVQALTGGNTVVANPNIMDLPEVIGVLRDKQIENIKGCQIEFLPAELMAKKWRTENDTDEFNGEKFNEIAEEFGYKTPQYGFWEEVTTPQGKAREFMYINGSMLDYLRKKWHKN